MSDMFALTAQNLCVQLAKKNLLSNINCQISDAKITMVLGHNGAGKSLFLQALHGLIPLNHGRIIGPPKQMMKMVHQKPILLRRSAGQHFDFIAPHTDPETRLNWFERASLSDHIHHPARLLSGGQAQKLMLIAMLATEPSLLFLDEPTAHLDYESTAFVETTLAEARARGITLVMSSHNRTQVKRMADHVLFLDAGRLVDDGPVRSFFKSPQSIAAQRWLDFA